MTVVSLADARSAREPHWEGPVRCVGCGHEWHGVALMGVMWVDCPACSLPKGTPKHPFGAAIGESVFQCGCGSEAMTAYFRNGKFRFACMGCGIDHTAAIFGECP